MIINIDNIISSSTFGGLGNYADASFSTTIGGQNLGAGQFVTATASVAMARTNTISQIQINFGGLESVWRLCGGTLIKNFPNNTSRTYQLQCISYFSGTTLNVLCIAVNQTGGVVSIPTITFNIRANLYSAPF